MNERAARTSDPDAHGGAQPRMRCPICGSASARAFRSRYVEVCGCSNPHCRHLFATDVSAAHGTMHDAEPDAAAESFEERNQRLIRFWESRRFVHATSRVLDVGAGNGHIARSLRARFPRASLCCIEEGEARAAQLAARGFEVHRDASALAAEREFDAILLIEVIEHVACPVSLLERLRRLLAPGGRVFLTTPCGELRTRSRRTHAYDTAQHVQFFTERSLRLAVHEAGFRDIHFEYIDALYPRQEAALSIAQLRRWMRAVAAPALMRLEGPRHLTGFIDP
ncbi:MAG TPA: class I SAM-dependent methyltransferase [Myxococcota bacterium]|nr:class I SAM-dependent methyltransferase [Myxococcota bacterium]